VRGRGKSAESCRLIAEAYEVLSVIQPASVRAVCYQLFNRGVLRGMVKAETNRVSTQLRDAREAGVIPWSWIVDETREAETISAWENPEAFVETVKRSYRRDRWSDQPIRVEVWSEKGTVRGTLAPVLNRFGTTFRVLHGYGSATSVHQVAQESRREHRGLVALYVGDWDPSGLHMSDVDLPQRLERYGGNVTLTRVALTAADIGSALPGFAADSKHGDPRYRWFVTTHGHRCWELDAMNPANLRTRVADAIDHFIDQDAWHRADITERAEADSLSSILSGWPGISRQASKCLPR